MVFIDFSHGFALLPRIKGNSSKRIQADPLLGALLRPPRQPTPPKPIQFPMKLKEFLRRLIGGRSYGNRLALFRRYWRYVSALSVRKKSDAEIEKSLHAILEEFSAEGVDEVSYDYHSKVFPNWRKMMLRDQRRNAAKSRWVKEKRKK
jgi:hypothetical protein